MGNLLNFFDWISRRAWSLRATNSFSFLNSSVKSRLSFALAGLAVVALLTFDLSTSSSPWSESTSFSDSLSSVLSTFENSVFAIPVKGGVILTFKIKKESSDCLEPEVLRHEVPDLVEKSCKVALGADLGCQLQSVDHLLLFFVYLFASRTALYLHSDVIRQDFNDLLISSWEANVPVLALKEP